MKSTLVGLSEISDCIMSDWKFHEIPTTRSGNYLTFLFRKQDKQKDVLGIAGNVFSRAVLISNLFAV